MNASASNFPRSLLLRLAVFFALFAAATFAHRSLQAPPATHGAQLDSITKGSWLDRPLTNWNSKSSGLPSPVATVDQQELRKRCPKLVRDAESAYDSEITTAGWVLYGAVQSYGPARVITAMSDADGMCRPLGYQAFVYLDATFAGTLSPVAMDSLTNGALTNVRLITASSIAAEFSRYRKTDLPCCPSRTSYVTYEISSEVPELVTPREIVTKRLCPDTGVTEATSADATDLYEVKWRLIEIKGIAVRTDNPYMKFEGAAKMFTGNGGCNQIAGGFEIDGRNLKLSRPYSTRLACVDSDAQQLEEDFLKALEQTTRFEVEGKILRFYDGNSLILVFQVEGY